MASAIIRRGFQCLVIITVTAIARETSEDATNAGNGTSESIGTSSATNESRINDTNGGIPGAGEKDDSVVNEPDKTVKTAGNGLLAFLTVRYPQELPAIFIGSVVRMEFIAYFGHYKVFRDGGLLTITLIASNDSTLALSRIVNIRVGTNLRFSEPDWKNNQVKHKAPGFNDSKLGVAFDTSVDFYLGSVTDNQLSYRSIDSMLIINYELVCVGLGTAVIGETVPSQVLVKGTELLVLHVEFVFKGTTMSVDTEPDFYLINSTTQIEAFKPLTMETTMIIPYTTSDVIVTVDAFPLHQDPLYGGHYQQGDGSLSRNVTWDTYKGLLVQSIQGRSVGTAFNYSVFPEHLTASGYDICPLQSTLSLMIGPLVNRESLLESPDHGSSSYITMDITLLLTDPTMAAPAVSVVFGMEIGNIMLLQNITLAVSQQNDDSGTSGPVSEPVEDFLTSETPNNISVSSGQTSHVQFLLHTLRESNQTYVLSVNTTLGNFSVAKPYDNALKLLSVKPVFFGSNLECQPVITHVENLHGENNVWAYDINVTVFNMGIYNDSDSDVLKLNATMVVLGTAKEGDVFNMTTTLKGRHISKTFTVDGPPKVQFRLYNTYKTKDIQYGGYPFFARIVIHTPLGSQMIYNVTMHVSQLAYYLGKTTAEILTVNFIKSGSNLHDGFQTSDFAVQLSNSTNSGVLDTGTLTFFIINSGENVDDGANDLMLEVVVMRPKHPSTSVMRVDVNGIGYQSVLFRSAMYIGYQHDKESFLSAMIGSTCINSEYYTGQLNVFEVHVQTIRTSTGGALQIIIPSSEGFRFENASVISKGKNVVCVNEGPVEATTQMDGSSDGTVRLTLPLLCNREMVDSEDEDKLVIGVTVMMGHRPTDAIFIAELMTPSTGENISQAFTIVPLIDMGSLVNVRELILANTTFEEMDGGSKDPRLNWSVDGKTFHTMKLKIRLWDPSTDELTMYPEQIPLLARFFGAILSTQDACYRHLKIYPDNDVPLLHGGVNKTGPVLNELASALNYGDDSCMMLAGPGSIVDLPYLWAEFNTSMFGFGKSGRFNVYLAGDGLLCNATKGPQVIMVVFPKQTPNLDGENQQRLCDVFGIYQRNGYMSCKFACDCSGAEECDRFTLLIMNTGSLENTSKLCIIEAYQLATA